MNQPILDIQDLSVVFDTAGGRISAIRDLSLAIGPGEILAVVGESGCGKSVLCKSIMGLLPYAAEITKGSIRLDGKQLVGLSDRDYCRVRGGDVSMVFQDPFVSLDPACTIGAQIAEAIRAHNTPRRFSRENRHKLASKDPMQPSDPSQQTVQTSEEIRARVIELMDTVGIDQAAQRYDSYPWMLSGGMRQRCVLAMALVQNPKLLIADEPTTALDVTVQKEILELLVRLRESRNLSVLFISHDLGVVSHIADTVAIMYAGRIVETGTASEVLKNPAHPYTWGLLHALPAFAKDGKLRPIPGAPPSVPENFAADAFAERNAFALGIDYVQAPPFFDITPTHRAATWLADPRAPKIDLEKAYKRGTEQKPTAPDTTDRTDVPTANEPASILELRKLSHAFRLGRHNWVRAVEDVSFEIRRGEIFSLVGESGCGKTTLARCILGMYTPLQGSVIYDGMDVTDRKNRRLYRDDKRRLAREIQFISQDPGAALDPRMTVRDLISEPLQIHGLYPERRKREEYIISMLREVQLDERVLDRVPAQLSGGQKQRVSIARAYCMNPTLLVADEPLASLDVSIQAQIVELLLTLQKRHNTSILFISHDLAMVELISDRVGVMYRGHLVEVERTPEVFRHPKHPYTKQLLSAVPTVIQQTSL